MGARVISVRLSGPEYGALLEGLEVTGETLSDFVRIAVEERLLGKLGASENLTLVEINQRLREIEIIEEKVDGLAKLWMKTRDRTHLREIQEIHENHPELILNPRLEHALRVFLR